MAFRVPLCLAVAVALLGPGAAALAQYKWTDGQGHVGYGDQPPRDAVRVERIEPSSLSAPGDALSTLPYELRRAASHFPAVLYAAPGAGCAPCDAARSFLRGRGIPYTERTVSTARDIAAYEALGGNRQLPGLGLGRDLLRGFEAGTWSEALSRADYPHDSLLPRSWQWPAAAPLAPPEATAAAAPAAAEGN